MGFGSHYSGCYCIFGSLDTLGHPVMRNNDGLGCLGCSAQVPAFLGGLIGLLWWFILLWDWLGLFWAILATVFLGFIPTGVIYYVLMLAFGPLFAMGMTRFGQSTTGQFFIGAMGLIISLILSAILILSVVWLFDSL